MQSRLGAARRQRGWSQTRLVSELKRRADIVGVSVMAPSSLQTALSRWENGHHVPDAVYRRLLRDIFALTDAELGFAGATAVPKPEHDDEFRARLAACARVDSGLVTLLRGQTDSIRRLDRRLGAPVLAAQMRAHIDTMSDLLQHAVLDADRRPLAEALADAATLAGWQALDMGAVRQAWGHYELAKDAARTAGDPALLAHAKGEQAFALLDINQPQKAFQLVREARREAGSAIPARLSAWLWAAEAELAAAAGDGDHCLRALDGAVESLPAWQSDPDLPYLALDECHLTRWRGSALARLGSHEAISQLDTALAGMDADYTRARGGLHIDLAQALITAGEPTEAAVHIDAARELAAQTGSHRQQQRLELLAA